MIVKISRLLALLLLAGCAQNSSYRGGYCDSPCVITHNLGGIEGDAKAAAQKVIAGHQTVVIDGMCASACALFADWARPNVCITAKAVFAFHMASETLHAEMNGSPIVVQIVEDPKHTSDIDAWVQKRGGYPLTEEISETLKMQFSEARNFWPECPERR